MRNPGPSEKEWYKGLETPNEGGKIEKKEHEEGMKEELKKKKSLGNTESGNKEKTKGRHLGNCPRKSKSRTVRVLTNYVGAGNK